MTKLRKPTTTYLSKDNAEILLARLSEASSTAREDFPEISSSINSFELDGATWLKIESYYARLAVSIALSEMGYPSESTSNCVLEGRFPLYIHANLFNENIHDLLIGAATNGREEGFDLVRFLLAYNKITFEWPQTLDEKIAFTNYFALISQMKGQIIFDQRLNCAIKLLRSGIKTTSVGQFIEIEASAFLPFGTEIVNVEIKSAELAFESECLSKIRFIPLSEDKRSELISIGKENEKKLMSAEFTYGQMKSVGYVPAPGGRRALVSIDGRVIADSRGCYELTPQEFNSHFSLVGISIENDYDDDIACAKISKDDQYAQLVPYSMFYDLTTSAWCISKTDNLLPVRYRENAFEQLVLDDKKKKLIKAIVKNRCGTTDIIEGKGGGAVFLLDGPPGSGKTLTAEAVAEVIKRPLFKVSVSAIGGNLEDSEAKMSEILKLSARWNAVLLADEADTFMEKRSTNDMQRNAQVAMFLRLIEYYRGVMFLTTNRGGQIDEAFLSRVTLALHYKSLSPADMKTVWINLLGLANIKISEDDINCLMNYNMNGRDIKNAINAAQSLAAEDNAPVNADHLQVLLELNKEFMEMVKSKDI